MSQNNLSFEQALNPKIQPKTLPKPAKQISAKLEAKKPTDSNNNAPPAESKKDVTAPPKLKQARLINYKVF